MFKGKTFRTKMHIHAFCKNFFEFDANEQLFKREIPFHKNTQCYLSYSIRA